MIILKILIWGLIASVCFALPGYAYGAEVFMGANGNLLFDPSDISISAGEQVTFTNGDLPPHNMVVVDHPELSHPDLAFATGDSFDVTFDTPGDYEIQCEPHASAGMKGMVHVS